MDLTDSRDSAPIFRTPSPITDSTHELCESSLGSGINTHCKYFTDKGILYNQYSPLNISVTFQESSEDSHVSIPSNSSTLTPLASSSCSSCSSSSRHSCSFYPDLPRVLESSPKKPSLSFLEFHSKENNPSNESDYREINNECNRSCLNPRNENEFRNSNNNNNSTTRSSNTNTPSSSSLPQSYSKNRKNKSKYCTNTMLSLDKYVENDTKDMIMDIDDDFVPLFPSVSLRSMSRLRSDNIEAITPTKLGVYRSPNNTSKKKKKSNNVGPVYNDEWKSPNKVLEINVPNNSDFSNNRKVDLECLYKAIVSTRGKSLAQSQLKLFSAMKILLITQLSSQKIIELINQRLREIWEENPSLHYYGEKDDFNFSKIRMVPEVLIKINDPEVLSRFKNAKGPKKRIRLENMSSNIHSNKKAKIL